MPVPVPVTVPDAEGSPDTQWEPIIELIAERVVERLTAPPPAWVKTKEAAQRLGVSRKQLDNMVREAPDALPGSPIPVNKSRGRVHRRWEAAKLDAWMRAYGEWKAEQLRPRTQKRRLRPARTRVPRDNGEGLSLLARVRRERGG